MDHNEAIQLQAAVKYVLGELSQPERDAYEEHYFDCSLCAVDVKAAAGFVDASRDLLRQESVVTVPNDSKTARGGWFAWFRPIVAVPAFAILLLVIGYQTLVISQKAPEMAASAATPFIFTSYPLRGVNTAGEDGRTLSIRPTEAFFLNFDFVPTRPFDSYIGQLEDSQGHVLLRSNISGANANQEAHLPIPGGLLHPGKYVLAFYGDPTSSGKPNPQNDAGRLPFRVEFRQ